MRCKFDNTYVTHTQYSKVRYPLVSYQAHIEGGAAREEGLKGAGQEDLWLYAGKDVTINSDIKQPATPWISGKLGVNLSVTRAEGWSSARSAITAPSFSSGH